MRLEIGPLASWVPSARHTIRPYASEILPELFESPACEVVAITAERTFWEKATILHQEAHREAQIPSATPATTMIFTNWLPVLFELPPWPRSGFCKIVVEFKRQFYPSTWARYDLAVPGKFKLLPATEPHLRHLERDYREMQVMLFGERPEFGSILQ